MASVFGSRSSRFNPQIMQEEFRELGRGDRGSHARLAIQAKTTQQNGHEESRDATSPNGNMNCPSGCVELIGSS